MFSKNLVQTTSFSSPTGVIDASVYFLKCSSTSRWFRGHELHFAQVREKGSCQTKIPNWRCKWTVDNTGIVSVFIHFDSPSSSPSSSVSIVGWKVDPCWTVSGWLTGWNVIKRARRFPQTETHTHTQIQLSYFVGTLSFVSQTPLLLHRPDWTLNRVFFFFCLYLMT